MLLKLLQTIAASPRALGNQPHRFLSDMHKIWGDHFRIPLGMKTATVFTSPAAVEQIFNRGKNDFGAAKGRTALNGLLPAQSVVYKTGLSHTRARRAVANSFAQATNVYDVSRLVGQLPQAISNHPNPELLLKRFCYELASEILIGRISEPLIADLNATVEAFGQIRPSAVVIRALGLLPSNKARKNHLMETRQRLLSRFENLLQAKACTANSLAACLLDHGRREGLSHEEIVHNGGMIGVAIALNIRCVLLNTLDLLAADSHWQKRLRAADAGPRFDGRGSADSANSLARAIVKESLRVRPLVPIIARGVLRDTCLEGVQLKKGQIVLVSPWLTHFRPDSFKAPYLFNPGRHLDSRFGHSLLPFGGGSNHCVGVGWSVSTIASVCGILCQQFQLQHEKQDRKMTGVNSAALVQRAFNLETKSFAVRFRLHDDWEATQHADAPIRETELTARPV